MPAPSPTVSDPPSDTPSNVPTTVAPTLSAPGSVTVEPTTVATLPLAGDGGAAPTSGDVVTTTTSGPTSTQETFDVQNREDDEQGNTISVTGSEGLGSLTIAMISVVGVAAVAVIAALFARKKFKSQTAATKSSPLGVAGTTSEGGASISDISTDGPPSAANLAEI